MPNQGKLTIREYQVLKVMEKIPMGTYDEIHEKTGMAKSVIYNILKSLEHPEDRKEPYFNVVAHPNLLNLGLEIVEIFANTNKINQLYLLDEVCTQHPYTAYRAPYYGKNNGMLIQFRIPINSGHLIKTLFDELQVRQIIDSYQYFHFPSPQIYTTTDIDKFNLKTLDWQFNWNDFFEKISKSSKVKIENVSYPKMRNNQKHPPIKNWLKREDIAILAELFRNSRQKNIEIIQKLKKKGYNFTPQNFSRRLKRVKKKCVEDYYLFMDPKATEITNSICVVGIAESLILKKLYYYMKIEPIPFLSTFKSYKNRLFWYIHLPPTHISSFLMNLRKLLTTFDFYYIDHPNVRSYLPWDKTYDEHNQCWKNEHAFMIDSVINQLKINEFLNNNS